MIVVMREFGPEIREANNSPQDPVQWEVALAQHRAYQALLRELAAKVIALSPLPHEPNGVFVQDTAVVLPDVIFWTRPGKESRRGEVAAMQKDFLQYPVGIRAEEFRIGPPATLDGGDVIVVDKTFFVARTTRTNREGIEQVRGGLPSGYRLVEIPVLQPERCLHLRTGCSYIGKSTFLVNPDWVDAVALQKEGYEIIEVDPSELMAANTRLIGETVILAAAFPETAQRVRSASFPVATVGLSEIAKAGGGASCVTLLIPNL